MALADIREIEIGAYYGECTGYCDIRIEVSRDSLTCSEFSLDRKLSDRTVVFKISHEAFEAICEAIDMKALQNSPDIVGNPYWGDPEGYWIVVRTKNDAFRIDYEKGKEDDWIKQVRDKIQELKTQQEGAVNAAKKPS